MGSLREAVIENVDILAIAETKIDEFNFHSIFTKIHSPRLSFF